MATTNVNTRLRELHGSGYEIVDGQPDIEGWTIMDTSGHKIGVVDDMLFDAELQKVRYIVANLKGNDFDLEKRRVLIPIGMAELHQNNDYVVLPSVSAWQMRALPSYTKGELREDDEQDIFTIFSSASAGAVTGAAMRQQKASDFYEHTNFNHDNLYKNRRNAQIDQPTERRFRVRQDSDASTRNQEVHDTNLGRTVQERFTTAEVRSTNDHVHGTDDRTTTSVDTTATDEHLMQQIRKMEADLQELKSRVRSSNR